MIQEPEPSSVPDEQDRGPDEQDRDVLALEELEAEHRELRAALGAVDAEG